MRLARHVSRLEAHGFQRRDIARVLTLTLGVLANLHEASELFREGVRARAFLATLVDVPIDRGRGNHRHRAMLAEDAAYVTELAAVHVHGAGRAVLDLDRYHPVYPVPELRFTRGKVKGVVDATFPIFEPSASAFDRARARGNSLAGSRITGPPYFGDPLLAGFLVEVFRFIESVLHFALLSFPLVMSSSRTSAGIRRSPSTFTPYRATSA